MEWKQRKKFQQRLIAAKKKLCELEQKHVFQGFMYGEKTQRSLLADQIVSVNSKLLQQAMQDIRIPSKRWNLSKFISANSNKLLKNHLRISNVRGIEDDLEAYHGLQQKGLHLMSKGKVAVILVVDENNNQGKGSGPDIVDFEGVENSSYALLQALLCDDKRFSKVICYFNFSFSFFILHQSSIALHVLP
ncbi:hypothetical protein HHK36_005042 [Tetracentron sinense]|uniref:Uncharacterized protein n=1 Tax=Tetracentron sinense TaxID=13715 RepID=A0A834ZME7_TETSI|nr:hypothetical protein HHK36_005042 [Tetracentron sinense]